LFVITSVMTLMMASINFFDEQKIARYLKDICLLLIWASSLVIAVVTTARQIPAERESRTIFPLLAKPVSRWHVVLGKFLGCWFACGIALIVFYLFFTVVSVSREGQMAVLNYVQAFWMHWAMLAIVVSMVLLGSVVFSAPSANSTISFVAVITILVLGAHLHKIATAQPFVTGLLLSILYFLIPHFEWFYSVRERLVFDQDLLAWSDVLLATVVAAFTGLLLFATWLVSAAKSLRPEHVCAGVILCPAFPHFPVFHHAYQRATDWPKREGQDHLIQVLLGDGRQVLANHMFTQADVYFHSGYYPSVFDQQCPEWNRTYAGRT
jgi:ABC-type transport system involved in multi-copper enzyme maturation permease subunit